MIVELNATENQVKKLINLLNDNSDLNEIISQLKSALAQNDDSQSGEIPVEGDNAVIKRME